MRQRVQDVTASSLIADARPGHPAERYALVVVDIGDRVRVPGDIAPISRVAEVLRRSFTRGETLARLAPGRAVALCPHGADLAGTLCAVDGMLATPHLEHDLHAAVWVESLPRTFALVQGLLLDLSR